MQPATDRSGMPALLSYPGCDVRFGAVAVAPAADFGDIVGQPGGATPQDHIR